MPSHLEGRLNGNDVPSAESSILGTTTSQACWQAAAPGESDAVVVPWGFCDLGCALWCGPWATACPPWLGHACYE